MSALEQISAALQDQRQELAGPYYVPGLWIDYQSTAPRPVNPYDFYADKVGPFVRRNRTR
jgi:hypothetical protein